MSAFGGGERIPLSRQDEAGRRRRSVLLVRGSASVQLLDDVSPEYAAAATRYFGEEQGQAWIAQLRGQPMARVAIRPSWAAILDFQTRFPSALKL